MSDPETSCGVEGWVFDVQRGSLVDGPGIRTTVFLQGCPLRCQWCHNPESWHRVGHAGEATPCAETTRRITSTEVLDLVERDRAFYAASGGGMTVSGGEPTTQAEFCLALLRGARERGVHTVLDTSGLVARDRLEAMDPFVDLYLFDLKATGDEQHLRLTGVRAEPIRRNLDWLLERGRSVRLRCPIVPGLNDDDAHLQDLAEVSQRTAGLDVMPYHATGSYKYERMGRSYPLAGMPTMDAEAAEAVRGRLREFGAVLTAPGS